MKKILNDIKKFFLVHHMEIIVLWLVITAIFVAYVVAVNHSTKRNNKIYEVTAKFQNGEIKTFVCDKIVYNGEFATITVDDIVYKIAYENLEVKIYENTKN